MNSKQISQALKEVTLVGLIGRPGAGKEFTGDALLNMNLGYHRIIMSELIGRFCLSGTGDGARIKQILDSGNLVPDDDVVDLFFGEVSHMHMEGRRFIICDGFPRNPHQLEMLREHGARFIMFHIELDEDLAIRRMLERKRPGENREKCEKRQRVFMESTYPMISYFKTAHPESYQLIDGSQESDIRASQIHDLVLRCGSQVLSKT